MSGWSNWFGNQTCNPQRVETAVTEAQVQESVARATAEGLTLRAPGAGHSLPPVVNSDGVILDVKLETPISADAATRRTTIPTGWRLSDTFGPLREAGLAFKNVGELETATVSGAVSTGVHGTGVTLQCLSASVRGIRIVTATGDVVDIESDTELLRAAQVSLGMLGVITQVDIEVTTAYDLFERSFFLDPDEMVERWDELLHGHRHLSFFYLPDTGAADLYGEQLPPVPPGSREICYASVRDVVAPGASAPALGDLERQDRMDKILIYHLEPNYREIEFSVPLEMGKETLAEIRQRFRTHHPDYAQPVQVRFVAQDDALLSTFCDGPKAVFSIPDVLDADYGSVLADMEQLFYSKGGLPHWGKEHTLDPARLTRLQPGYERFCEIRRELDPTGTFLNHHLRELFE